MRFSTATVLGLAASATAAVLPRSQLGSWTVSVSESSYANGYKTRSATAVYTSDSYPEGITSTCSFVANPVATETDTCDEGFTYTYDGTSEC